MVGQRRRGQHGRNGHQAQAAQHPRHRRRHGVGVVGLVRDHPAKAGGKNNGTQRILQPSVALIASPHATNHLPSVTAQLSPTSPAPTHTTHLQLAVKWLSRPQGEPSGVCTGHRNPQDSGSSLRTVVVRSSAK